MLVVLWSAHWVFIALEDVLCWREQHHQLPCTEVKTCDTSFSSVDRRSCSTLGDGVG